MIADVRPVEIAVDDPRWDDIRDLLATHLAFARASSPPADVHALDLDGLCAPDVTFFSARRDGLLVGVGALKELDEAHGEVKSMHTAASARGSGVARAMLDHLLGVARKRRYRRVSLETGTMEVFTPARALYASAGFVRCDPFNGYWESPNSVCMTLELSPDQG